MSIVVAIAYIRGLPPPLYANALLTAFLRANREALYDGLMTTEMIQEINRPYDSQVPSFSNRQQDYAALNTT